MLRVSEIFASIQGESTFAGLPCVFVRLAGCNLNCTYCDTAYARPATAGIPMSVPEIISAVRESALSVVEVTGGEPLLQEETPVLLRELLDLGFTVLVETNGSQPLSGLDPRLHLVVDVKTPGSGMAESFRPENLAALRPHHQLKFVLVDESDFYWSRDFIRHHPGLPSEIIFSPVTTTLAPARLAELILENRLEVRLQLQLHKNIWPTDERGR
jgi:7-carboxy-7-deazaguanine synthase